MKIKFFLSLTVFLFVFVEIKSQSLHPKSMDIAANKIATNTINKIIAAEISKDGEDEIIKIIIMPIYSPKNEVTDLSNELTVSIAHKLNALFDENNLDFEAWGYREYEDSIMHAELGKTFIEPEGRVEYYNKLLTSFSPDFLISGRYSFDVVDEKFYLQDFSLKYNYLATQEVKSLSIDGIISVDMNTYRKKATLLSFIPVTVGLAQLYKTERTKGTIFFISNI